jgi:hypothetical protein
VALFGRKKHKEPVTESDAELDEELDEEIGEEGGEERAIEGYRQQIMQILSEEGPESRDWKRLLQSVEKSHDEDYLVSLRAGAEEIWDAGPRGRATQRHLVEDPETVKSWVDDLVHRISARLRHIASAEPKAPAIISEAHHQEAMGRVFARRAVAGVTISAGQLVPEPDNPHDANAVAVMVEGERVGYLKRDVAAIYSPVLQKLGQPLACRIRIQRQHTSSGERLLLAFLDEPLPDPSTLARPV